MKIAFFTLCDYAQNNQGKLTIIGIFNRIAAESFPFVYYNGFYIVAKVESRETKACNFKLSCIDPTGKDFVPPLEGCMEINNPKNDDRVKSADLTLGLGSLTFSMPGTYVFKLKVEDCETRYELYVDGNI